MIFENIRTIRTILGTVDWVIFSSLTGCAIWGYVIEQWTSMLSVIFICMLIIRALTELCGSLYCLFFQANDDIQNDTVGTASLNGISNIEPLSEIVNGLNFRLWI